MGLLQARIARCTSTVVLSFSSYLQKRQPHWIGRRSLVVIASESLKHKTVPIYCEANCPNADQ